MKKFLIAGLIFALMIATAARLVGPIAAKEDAYQKILRRFPPSQFQPTPATPIQTETTPSIPTPDAATGISSDSNSEFSAYPASQPQSNTSGSDSPYSQQAFSTLDKSQSSHDDLLNLSSQNYSFEQPVYRVASNDLDSSYETKNDPDLFPNAGHEAGEAKKVISTPPVAELSLKAVPQDSNGMPSAATTQFKLAEQPQLGERYFQDAPVNDPRVIEVEAFNSDFRSDPMVQDPYESEHEKWLYRGKTLNATQRPLIELGRPWYQLGQLSEPNTTLGFHNPVVSQFLIFGDFRTAAATNSVAGDSSSLMAVELNLNFHYQLTSTERFLFSMSPLDRGDNTRYLFDEEQFIDRFDPNINFGYFEGDIGAIAGGAIGTTLPFDLPVAIGFMPMLVQNGVWMDDAFVGIAATIPARNSPLLDIANMDITFLWAFDEISSDAFEGNNDAAKMYAVLTFIEALGGYFEVDYAYLEDRNASRDRSYHNMGFGFTRRYGRWISNSVRVIANAGQSDAAGPNTADGVVLLLENSLITSKPSTFIPYCNLFAGFDRPQSASRGPNAGGILNNTGILFESDGMTGYPTLDPTANNTWGGAIGLNMIAPDFSQQLIVEAAAVQVMNSNVGRNAIDNQYGVGVRYQIPLSNSWILRSDAMYGHFQGADDVHGARVELRKKF